MPGDIRCNSKKYRVMRNGNGKYIVQERGKLWGWNTLGQYIGSGLYGLWVIKYYDDLSKACVAVRQFEKQDRAEVLNKQWTEVRCD